MEEDDTSNRNNLSRDVHVKGSIKFGNKLIFDGTLEGKITTVDGVLTIGENGNVRGDLISKVAIVSGKVHGNITVRERCELHESSELMGDLKAVHLVIEGGATFVGRSEVSPNRSAIQEVAIAQKEERQKIGAPR
jgi:cytoskeletal protein CcmA (bactofilin family)